MYIFIFYKKEKMIEYFIIFIWKIIFFTFWIIVILLTIYYLYDLIINYFKKKKRKNHNELKNIITNIEVELGIKKSIDNWNMFKKYILKLEKEELSDFFYESYEIYSLLLKYNEISFITINIFSEILVWTEFFWRLKKEYIIEIKKLFKKSKTEKDFIDNLKKNKNIWKFIKNNLIIKSDK